MTTQAMHYAQTLLKALSILPFSRIISIALLIISLYCCTNAFKALLEEIWRRSNIVEVQVSVYRTIRENDGWISQFPSSLKIL